MSYDIFNIDVFVSSIIVMEESKTYELKIKNCWDLRCRLCNVFKGDTFNIKGIGKLKVMQIAEFDKERDFIAYYERIFSCRKISEWTDEKETSLAVLKNTLTVNEILRQDWAKTWGSDVPYVE